MQALIVSDTHGNFADLCVLKEKYPKINTLFFLGDGLEDVRAFSCAYPNMEIYAVAGNCDLPGCEKTQGLVQFGSCKIFYTHGHLFQVKAGLGALKKEAIQQGACIVLFGHTHQPFLQKEDNVLYFNPGACSGKIVSYGLLQEKARDIRLTQHVLK